MGVGVTDTTETDGRCGGEANESRLRYRRVRGAIVLPVGWRS
jgi:hypothetical protein